MEPEEPIPFPTMEPAMEPEGQTPFPSPAPFLLPTATPTRSPAPTPQPSSTKKVPDYAIGILVGAVLLAGVGTYVALRRGVPKTSSDIMAESFL